jgi:DNA-binding NarL/FixJ family response regulator
LHVDKRFHRCYLIVVIMSDGLERPGCDERARVLVADDHQSLLDRVVSILHDEYDVVGTVTDGTSLVAAEATLTPDVLVIDISMPGMSGLEAASSIRRRGSHAAVVCLTAHQEPEIVEAAWRAGVLGYVTKTSLAQDLLPAVRAALGGHRFVSAEARGTEQRA